jgi:hypothetical protein
MKAILVRLLGLALLPAGGWAQGAVQNMDIYFLFGATTVKLQTVPGTGITLSQSTAISSMVGYGYQVARTKAGGLWVEVAPGTSAFPHQRTNATPDTVELSTLIQALGLRFMVPVHPRISVYGATGGGIGFFNYPVQGTGPSPAVQVNSISHGVLDFGGGADWRLRRWVSIRAEVRDYVTGRGLSGVAGPNHVLAFVGIATHF